MKCVILAAGYATRLYPLTQNFPKPLLKVQDKAILDWLIDDIDSLGLIDEYVVTFLEMIGFDKADIRRIKAQEQRARGLNTLAELGVE